PFLLVEVLADHAVEALGNGFADGRGATGLAQDDEVVAADVAQEVALPAQVLEHSTQDLGGAEDQSIPALMAVEIVESLEIVDVDEHVGEGLTAAHPLPELALDLRVARQPRERIGISKLIAQIERVL